MSEVTDPIAVQAESRILLVRGQKVMLDSDLAALYDVPTKVLNQAVKRNAERFPADFMFQLTAEEADAVNGTNWSQFVTSSRKHRGKVYRPYAFTEQGVAMLSGVLRSARAVQVNIAIMRAFVRLRQMLATHAELARKLEEMEQRYDEQFRAVFEAIRELMEPPPAETKREIGFHAVGGDGPTKRAKGRSRR